MDYDSSTFVTRENSSKSHPPGCEESVNRVISRCRYRLMVCVCRGANLQSGWIISIIRM